MNCLDTQLLYRKFKSLFLLISELLALLLNLHAVDALSLKEQLLKDQLLTTATHLLFILDSVTQRWNSKLLNFKLNSKLYFIREVVSPNKNSGKMEVTMVSTI